MVQNKFVKVISVLAVGAGMFVSPVAHSDNIFSKMGSGLKKVGGAIASPFKKKTISDDCAQDLSKGVIVMLSGGGFDAMNPIEVRNRMDDYIKKVNEDEVVNKCSGGKGLKYKLLAGQTSPHLHQAQWPEICKALEKETASPLIIAGHSNGGAAAVSLARCVEKQGKTVDLLITADSVGTTNDLGNVYQVPANVRMNVNTFVKPNATFFILPFPVGHANTREDGSIKDILNIGLNYNVPGAIAHRNAFFDFAGGDLDEDSQTYSRPYTLLDITVASLEGATNDQISQTGIVRMTDMSKAAGITIDVESESSKLSLTPENE